jgi:uncharacterized membrane protein YeaQ/YmgE (transglycosylase-associated protein family)
MGSAVSALLYLGFGAGFSILASTMRRNPNRDKKKMFVGNMLVGSTGAWLGGTLFGAVGPSLYGISLIATALSSASAVLGYNAISGRMDKKDDSQQES